MVVRTGRRCNVQGNQQRRDLAAPAAVVGSGRRRICPLPAAATSSRAASSRLGPRAGAGPAPSGTSQDGRRRPTPQARPPPPPKHPVAKHPGLAQSSTAAERPARTAPARTLLMTRRRRRLSGRRRRRHGVRASSEGVPEASVKGRPPAAETASGGTASDDTQPASAEERLNSPAAKDKTFEQRVAGQPVGALDAGAGDFARRVEPGDGGSPVEVGGYAAHPVVGRRGDGHQLTGPVEAGFAGGRR